MTQSNEPTIEEKNKAIALFDGYEFHEGDPTHKCNFCFAGDEPCTPAVDRFVKDCKVVFYYELKYHTSWDWLMPCWNNLRTELFQCMPASGFNDGFDKYGDAWKTACFNAEIQNAHKVVYSAIKWLNQQKQKDGKG